MTACSTRYNKRDSLLSYITAFLTLLLLCHSREVSEGIYSGVRFAAKCLIPTLFPFFIISDMILSFGLPFGEFLNKRGLNIILIGLICGFPHGARCATKLFESGAIDKQEYERLLILSNSPSLAFVISGIGAGMMRSAVYGIMLFTSLVLSVAVLSFLTKSTQSKAYQVSTDGAGFNLSISIKNAGAASISVSSYIIFFYGINALISRFLNGGALSCMIAAILEIGTGSVTITLDKSLAFIQKMTLLGFTVGFSSLSVFMQCSAFISDNISKGKLLAFKLLQGTLCALFAFLLSFIYEKWLF